MEDFHVRVPIEALHVEIDGRNAYRQAHSVDDLVAYLLSEKWPVKSSPSFHRALATSIEAMQFYLEASTARAAFVDAAHAAGMHVLPDDVEEIRKAS